MRTDLGVEYVRQPANFVDGIPIFSERDSYVENYERIASDHVKAMDGGNENPFMDVELWKLSEGSTRRIIVQHVPAGARILDVGVGLGRVMGPLVQYERFGIDISLDYLRRARSRGLQVAFSRIEDMPFADGCFDAAVVCDVLEHVLDLNACVHQILRVIKPGGLLIVRVPYKEDLSGYLDPSMPYEFVHLRNFDEHTLRLFFEKIMRCRVEYVEQVAPYLSPDRLTLRLPARGGFLQEIINRLPRAEPPVASSPVASNVVQRVLSSLGSVFVQQQPAPPAAPPEPPDALALLKYLAKVDDEKVFQWLSNLRTDHPDWYEMLLPHVTQAVEINVVVRKGE